jgi:hypothetical protein
MFVYIYIEDWCTYTYTYIYICVCARAFVGLVYSPWYILSSSCWFKLVSRKAQIPTRWCPTAGWLSYTESLGTILYPLCIVDDMSFYKSSLKTSLSYHEIPQNDHEIMIESSLKSHQIMIFGPRAFSKIRTSSGAPGSWKSTWINVGGDWDLDGLSGISWGFMWFIHIYMYIYRGHSPSIQVSSGDVSLHSGVKFSLTQQQSNCMHFYLNFATQSCSEFSILLFERLNKVAQCKCNLQSNWCFLRLYCITFTLSYFVQPFKQ